MRLRAAGLVALVLLGACSSRAAAHRNADTRPPSSTTATAAPAPTLAVTTTTVRRKSRPVVLAFAGDVHFEGVLRVRLAADPAGALASIAPLLAPADVAMVNLETAITARGTPQVKQFTFRPTVRHRCVVVDCDGSPRRSLRMAARRDPRRVAACARGLGRIGGGRRLAGAA